MYYVYLLKNEAGKRYIGYTTDLRKRLADHNKGGTPSTKGSTWEVAYYEAYASEQDAKRRERRLKDSGQARRWLYERASESLCV